MFRLRSVFLVFLMALILPYAGASPAAAAQLGMPDTQRTRNFINLYIDEIKILGNTGDLVGAGEFRLIVLAADTTGKSTGMFCPGDKPLKMRKGDVIKAPCLAGMSIDEATVSDGVYLTVMVVDEDKSSLPADLSYEAATSGLSSAFGRAVKERAITLGLTTAKNSTPYTFIAGTLISFLSGKLKEWIQKADVIGSQGIYLSRKDSWSANKTTTVKSKDGGIQITYTIVRTSSAPPNQNAPVLGGSTSTSTQTSPGQPSTQKYWCDDLSKVKLKVGDRAKVLWLKVNLRTAPIVPQEYYENSIAKLEEGTTITIIGGPACAHEGTWWQVRTGRGQTGWMREYVKSSGYLIGR
ncbi:MAG: SH3 domain-containing protein [Anaerolineales bacterium]|nr:MAG: SH3 domain-containing protein [Anaerolineales bacterium]